MEKFKINTNYFKCPPSKIRNYFVLSKYDFVPIELTNKYPCIFVTPKVSPIDENLISKCIKDKFVFIKDDIVKKISLGELSQKDQAKLLNEIKKLSDEGFSISILYGTSPSIFGEFEKLSEKIILFLKSTNLDIKFLTFPGEYFSHPVWSNKPRKTKIHSSQQLSIKQRFLEGLTEKEVIASFNNNTPSSATTYLTKYPIWINSNELARGIERVMYCCPHCKKLFSIYSEFSCVKCRDCGMVIEFSPDGKILFSNNLNSFDNIQKFQFDCLIKNELTINEIVQYKNITQIISENCKNKIKIKVILQVYAEKLVIVNSLTNRKQTINFEDINYFEYFYGNMIKIKTKNAKEFCFVGNSFENFLIIKDLITLNKN